VSFKPIKISRFGKCRPALLFAGTALTECRNQVSFLESVKVVENCLIDRGQAGAFSSTDRAQQIRNHVKMAIDFWDQAEQAERSPAVRVGLLLRAQHDEGMCFI
jgi:hypothetical protein